MYYSSKQAKQAKQAKMTTRKYKNNKNPKNRTKKRAPHLAPAIKLIKNIALYAAKSYRGDAILEHTKELENKRHNNCIKESITWLSNLETAKLYKNNTNHLYKWTITKPTKLVKTNKQNIHFFEKVFKETPNKLEPFLTSKTLGHPYFSMTTNEKALYEFKFVFGYLTIQEQYKFLKLLQTEKNIKIKKSVVLSAINYYRVNNLLRNQQSQHKNNRISFYELDKHVVNNFCKALPSCKALQLPNRYRIEGLYQSGKTKSFWYPSFLKYSENMEEYILFNPHHELKYEGQIE